MRFDVEMQLTAAVEHNNKSGQILILADYVNVLNKNFLTSRLAILVNRALCTIYLAFALTPRSRQMTDACLHLIMKLMSLFVSQLLGLLINVRRRWRGGGD